MKIVLSELDSVTHTLCVRRRLRTQSASTALWFFLYFVYTTGVHYRPYIWFFEWKPDHDFWKKQKKSFKNRFSCMKNLLFFNKFIALSFNEALKGFFSVHYNRDTKWCKYIGVILLIKKSYSGNISIWNFDKKKKKWIIY